MAKNSLFRLILDSYTLLCGEELKTLLCSNKAFFDFSEYLTDRSISKLPLTCDSLMSFLLLKKWDIKDKTVCVSLLEFLNSNIYYFDEYKHLFVDSNLEVFENEKFYLIISPENSITNQVEKLLLSKRRKLRIKRFYDPKLPYHELGFNNLNFFLKDGDFTIKQRFIRINSLSKGLYQNTLKITFPVLDIDNADDNYIFKRIDLPDKTFTLEYKKEYSTIYSSLLKKTMHDNQGLVCFPELSFSNECLENRILHGELFANYYDKDFLIVAGTTWNNGSNTCYVFNDSANSLVEQRKYNPYAFEQNNEIIKEGIETCSHFEINLLHIDKFGLIGFPICSDLLSSKYIEYIYCNIGVSMLIVPCFSKSNDIFSSLFHLSENYEIATIAVNVRLNPNNLVCYVTIPSISSNNRRSAKCINVRKTKKDVCSLDIKLKNFTK